MSRALLQWIDRVSEVRQAYVSLDKYTNNHHIKADYDSINALVLSLEGQRLGSHILNKGCSKSRFRILSTLYWSDYEAQDVPLLQFRQFIYYYCNIDCRHYKVNEGCYPEWFTRQRCTMKYQSEATSHHAEYSQIWVFYSFFFFALLAFSLCSTKLPSTVSNEDSPVESLVLQWVLLRRMFNKLTLREMLKWKQDSSLCVLVTLG